MSASITTIPASYFVDIVPGVIGAGQPGLTLIGLMLTTNPIVPVGQVLSFPNLAAVQSYFGVSATESAHAAVYFAGYNGCTKLPAALLFGQYPLTAVAAYVRGGALNMTLAQLQAIPSESITVITDTGTLTDATFTQFSSATSFANAAQWLSSALPNHGPSLATGTAAMGFTATGTGSGTSLTLASVSGYVSFGPSGDSVTGTGIPSNTTIVSQTSGTPNGAGVYVTNNATTISGTTATGSSFFLDVTAVATGTILAGYEAFVVAGGSFTDEAPLVISQVSGTTGGAGVYLMALANGGRFNQVSEGVSFGPPGVTYVNGGFQISSSTTGAGSFVDFPTGTLAPLINLTQATGAVQSLGAAAAVPATFMAGIVSVDQNWATFETLFDPDGGSGNTQKLLFAAWVNSASYQFAYLCTDTDITPTESTTATSSLGYILGQSNSSGTVPLWQPVGGGNHLASLAAAFAASVNFNATNGRATFAYKSQAGIVPAVRSATALSNLIANGYGSYVAAATQDATWQFAYPGQISGPFAWFDSFINQLWLNNQCQIALMTLLTSIGRLPYNLAGYAAIRQTLTGGAQAGAVVLPPASPVAAGLNNGVITPNVPLSAEQAIVVNSLAGLTIAPTLSAQGWYLSIQPATAAVRAARQSPTVILLYMDGGAIQQIDMSSLLVQ